MPENNINCGDFQLFKRAGSKHGKWHCSFTRPDGTQLRKSTGTSDLEEAKKVGKTWVDLTFGRIDPTKFLTVGKALDAYLQYSKENLKSHQSNVSRAKRIREYWGENFLLKNIRLDNPDGGKGKTIRGFISFLREKVKPLKGETLSNAAINRYLALMRVTTQDQIESGNFKEINPFSGSRRKRIFFKEKRTPRPYSLAEIRRIIPEATRMFLEAREEKEMRGPTFTKHSKYYFLLYVWVALLGGERGGALLKAKKDALKYDFENRAWFIEIEESTTKTEDENKVYLTEFVYNLSQEYPENREYFIDIRNNSRSTTTFARCWKRIRENCGIPDACGHRFRHTFATDLLTVSGIDIKTVSGLLRHSGTATTEMYLKAQADVKVLPAIEGLQKKYMGENGELVEFKVAGKKK